MATLKYIGARGVKVLGTLAVALGLGAAARAAPVEQVLHSFNSVRGGGPAQALVEDASGNLYGTTYSGGSSMFYGVAFELSPPGAGRKAWTEKLLHQFKDKDGQNPACALILDSAGNLYGTTQLGGAYGEGAVFELSPPPAGHEAWTETVLFSFNGRDGSSPLAGLVADGSGNLFGTTAYSYIGIPSTVYELSPPAEGQTAWTQKVLVQSLGLPTYSRLLLDSAGNLYGTIAGDAKHGANGGKVYEVSPPAAGQIAWTVKILHNFKGPEGYNLNGDLVADSAGNLYGTTYRGGPNHKGVVFELSPPPAGEKAWGEATLYSFDHSDGAKPQAGMVFDAAGDLYGTTSEGGAHSNGEVFELSPPGAGQTAWTEKVLFSFDGRNGAYPIADLMLDGAGDLYGTTEFGGAYELGTAFKVTP